MDIYAWLRRFLPARWADLAMVVWYAALILLIIAAWRGEADFRYGRL